jgi:predicted transcriptional regulator
MQVYLDLKKKFRKRLFNSLNLTQKEIANLVGSWQGNICRTIKGCHLLRVEQINRLLQLASQNWPNCFC